MVGIRPLVIMLPMVGIRPLVIMLPMVGIRPLVIMLDSPQCGRQHEYQLEGLKWGQQMGTECEESTTHWSHPTHGMFFGFCPLAFLNFVILLLIPEDLLPRKSENKTKKKGTSVVVLV